MSSPRFLEQLLARDPRKMVRFPDYPVDLALTELKELENQVEAAKKQAGAAETGTDALGGTLAGLATHVWRAKAKLVDPETGQPKEDARRVYRHVEAALETFAQMGVTLNDWTHQPYDPGLPVKVITFQPTAGVTRDTVVEAVKPTVIWKDQLLQLGEVVVGIPPNTEKPQ